MRAAASFLALLVALCLAQPSPTVAAAEPRVVLIVGPSGAATALYRERAEAAAKVAEKYTSNVVRVYSPNATWRAVKRALDGAAIVVYLGHGNGYPSRYRDSLFGGSQNGFGLNPVAGDGDDAHQYFGEDRIAAEISLGRNAVVLLHHLCYASGNTEPGMPQGTVEQARQRVDNYAAGFMAAGAGAVVAEAHMSPAWYVERLLTGRRSIDEVWQTSPTAHGNAFSFKSQRSPGYAAAMDPDTAEGGFYRSIVYRGGVGAGRLEASAHATALGAYEPTLVGTGFEAGLPYFKDRPTAGAAVQLWIPYETNEPESVEGLKVGVRWDPLDVAAEAAILDPETPAAEAPAAEAPPPEDSAEPETAPPAESSIDPMTAPFTFVEPERIGEVVEPVDAPAGQTRIVPTVTVPDTPGRYRLVLTLHDSNGDAFDAATQALMPSPIVYVSGEIGARYTVAASTVAQAGEPFDLPVEVANVGAIDWGQKGFGGRLTVEERPIAATLVAHWVALDEAGASTGSHSLPLSAGFGAGTVEQVVLGLTAPTAPGSYLVVVDVRVPGTGSLAVHGSEPALVRVTVE